jgi:hypothetical protein
VSGGRGVASWYGYAPGWGVDPKDPRESNALRVPESIQGVSLSSRETLGQFHYVTDPETGLTHVVQQTDVGPGVRTQKILDVAAQKAIQIGKTTRAQFEAAQERVERGELAPWQIQPTGFGRGTIGTTPKFVRPPTETQKLVDETGKPIDPYKLRGGETGAFDIGGTPTEARPRGELGESPTPSLLQGPQLGPMAKRDISQMEREQRKNLRQTQDALRKEQQDREEFWSGQPMQIDPRAMQRAVEKVTPGSEEEWELRKTQAIGDNQYRRTYSEFENVPGRSQWEGGNLPGEFEYQGKGGGSIQRDIERGLSEYDEYYDRPRWYERGLGYEKQRGGFDPRTGQPLPDVGRPISYRPGDETASSAAAQATEPPEGIEPRPGAGQTGPGTEFPEGRLPGGGLPPSAGISPLGSDVEWATAPGGFATGPIGAAVRHGGRQILEAGGFVSDPASQIERPGEHLPPPASLPARIGQAGVQEQIRGLRGKTIEAEQGRPILETLRGNELDRAAAPTVNGNGKLQVDVKGAPGVVVKAEGEGLFNKTEVNRQMEPMAE